MTKSNTKMRKVVFVILLFLALSAVIWVTFLYTRGLIGNHCHLPGGAIGIMYQEPYPSETNVFEGRVIKHISDISPGEPYVNSQYEVEVTKNIKGNLVGTVVFDFGRFGIEGIDPPLKIGKSFMFRSQFNQTQCWFSGRAY